MNPTNHRTVFLDGIVKMPLSVHANVLRVIQTKMATRIGRRTLYRKFKEYDIDQTEYKKR